MAFFYLSLKPDREAGVGVGRGCEIKRRSMPAQNLADKRQAYALAA